MTEEDWLTALPPALQNWWKTRRLKSLRKERLFGCACCRLLWPLLTNERYRQAVECSERYADDGRCKPAMVTARKQAAIATLREPALTTITGAGWRAADATVLVAHVGSDHVLINAPARAAVALVSYGVKDLDDARQEQAVLFRDIFGNPFRPVAFDPAWRTEHTTGLALKMYDDREFGAMPILADALEEAGCDNADILAHCREPGVHVRGCWVVDLVLGKS